MTTGSMNDAVLSRKLNTINGLARLPVCHQRAVQKRKISYSLLNTNTYFNF